MVVRSASVVLAASVKETNFREGHLVHQKCVQEKVHSSRLRIMLNVNNDNDSEQKMVFTDYETLSSSIAYHTIKESLIEKGHLRDDNNSLSCVCSVSILCINPIPLT